MLEGKSPLEIEQYAASLLAKIPETEKRMYSYNDLQENIDNLQKEAAGLQTKIDSIEEHIDSLKEEQVGFEDADIELAEQRSELKELVEIYGINGEI